MANEDIINPLGLPITDEDRALAAEERRVPDRDEIRQLLVTYFTPPISEAFVERIAAEFTRIRSHGMQQAAYHRLFGSPTQWRGAAWKEQFSGTRRSMTPSDQLLLMTHTLSETDPTLPQPRLNCPEPFVGTWEQVEPAPSTAEPCLWHLEPDGTFRSNSTDLPPGMTHWYVMSSGPRFSLKVQQKPLWGPSQSIFGITPTATELAGEHVGYAWVRTPYRLRRVA